MFKFTAPSGGRTSPGRRNFFEEVKNELRTFDVLRPLRGTPITIIVGNEGATVEYTGTLQDVEAAGTTASDGGASESAIDSVVISLSASRTQS